MRVLVTRPERQAERWVLRLREVGIEAVALPLIVIAPAPEPARVIEAWESLPGRRLVVFVSPNAVERFFALQPPGLAWPPGLEAASTGPGTSEALRRLGVRDVVEPAEGTTQFDSEALWLQLGDSSRDWRGASVLTVRGNGGRDWLAERLRECGATVEAVAAYQRVAPALDGDATLAVALDAPDQHLWLLSSSEAVEHLARATAGRDWRRAEAIATHPRIAERAQALGFARVHACAPRFDAVVACIQSLAP